ncbi:hypothetical protein HHI36_003394, partial [Cryptolaemus montrouzieri]
DNTTFSSLIDSIATVAIKTNKQNKKPIQNNRMAENESQSSLNEQASEVPLVVPFSDRNMKSVRKTSSTAVMGSGGSSTTFASATRRAWLHVGRAGKNVKAETVLRHLQRKFP